VLPLTRDTRGLLDAKAFAALPKGAYLINMARAAMSWMRPVGGAQLGASQRRGLDVFNTEPLPSDHPYWTHPKVP
jgi:Phosphoglycerate dehydrogenase and related dehydrogenases